MGIVFDVVITFVDGDYKVVEVSEEQRNKLRELVLRLLDKEFIVFTDCEGYLYVIKVGQIQDIKIE